MTGRIIDTSCMTRTTKAVQQPSGCWTAAFGAPGAAGRPPCHYLRPPSTANGSAAISQDAIVEQNGQAGANHGGGQVGPPVGEFASQDRGPERSGRVYPGPADGPADKDRNG